MAEIKEVDPKRPAKQLEKSRYLKSLDEEDRTNVLKVIDAFKQFCEEEKKIILFCLQLGEAL